jgi:carbon-monoxide dehydrogenase large subunit
MNLENKPSPLPAGIGAALPRMEDRRFLTGRGRFVDDMASPGMAFAHIVRSPHAHARIVRIDKRAAAGAPGVLAVLTGEDAIEQQIGELKCRSLPVKTAHQPGRSVLAADTVRHVGDCVALIVAETLNQAKDAGELLDVKYEVLPAVTLADAGAAGVPRVWNQAPGNLAFELARGDREAVDRKFTAAAHVTKLAFAYPRVSANTIEPRSLLAHRDPMNGRLTLCSTTQAPYRLREVLADVFHVSELELRVVAPDVGGAFGMKSQVYPEDVLVLWAARLLDRPVKWTAERTEAIAADAHGRDQIVDAELALDQEGRILALRSAVAVDLGAYLSTSAASAPTNATMSYSSAYVVPLIHVVVRAMFTNTSMMASYRGTAKPEGSFVIERLIDKAAREMNIDPLEMRRRNLVHSSAMPHKTASGFVYDCGELERVFEKAVLLADWAGFPARRAESERRGLRRGIGLALHCQRAGNQSERMEIRVAPNGSLAVHVGTHSHGQGHETAFAQMIHEWLGVELDRIRIFQGDTDAAVFGRGTFSQRSMVAGGSALREAAAEIIRKGKTLAGSMLEAAEGDIEFEHGIFRVAGTDRSVGFAEVARRAYAASGPISASVSMRSDRIPDRIIFRTAVWSVRSRSIPRPAGWTWCASRRWMMRV